MWGLNCISIATDSSKHLRIVHGFRDFGLRLDAPGWIGGFFNLFPRLFFLYLRLGCHWRVF